MKNYIITLVAFLFGTALHTHAATIYVKHNAIGSANGTSWTNAYTNLSTALSNSSSGDEIWVAAGTYKPTTGTSRTISFEMEDGVALYGGFSGNETSRSQRNWQNNVTILSGEIGNLSSKTDNSYHIVLADAVGHTTRLDGFTVENGNANGTFSDQKIGAGVYMNGADMTIRNCIFKSNTSTQRGGGISISTTLTRPISIENCDFHQNSSGIGAGFYIDQGTISTIRNCSFTDNTASSGAGFYIPSTATVQNIENCEMIGNHATSGAGGYTNSGNVAIKNCLFKKNTGTNGGGLYSNLSNYLITNCAFDSNTVSHGGGIYGRTGSVSNVINCRFLQNSGSALLIGKITGRIDSCTFTRNVIVAHAGGGAIRVYGGRYRILNSTFSFNGSTKSFGGAILQNGASVAIENCAFDSNYTSDPLSVGGALYATTGANGFSSIRKIHNSTFKGNSTAHAGGAIVAPIHNLRVSNCTFKGNKVTDAGRYYGGGALNLLGDTCSFTQCLFENNSADGTQAITTAEYLRGGAIAMDGKFVSINQCHFIKNSLGKGYNFYRRGGAVAIYGGLNSVIKNSVFLGNSLSGTVYSMGGAIYTENEDIKIQNCTFSGNLAVGSNSLGAACYVALPHIEHSTFANNATASPSYTVYIHGVSTGDTAKIINTVIWDNAGSTNFGSPGAGFVLRNSIVQGGYSSGIKVINSNPFFEDANGSDNVPGNIDDDLRLRSGSPAIDSGWTHMAPTKDITGYLRDLIPDIGAYEFGAQQTLPSLGSSGTGAAPDTTANDTTGSDTTSTPANTTTGFSLPDTLYACTPDTFLIPISTGDTIQHVIGWDFKLEYDTALLKPTGKISLIESDMIDTNYVNGYAFTPPGKDYILVSLSLNGKGPSGACWRGLGELLSVEFVKRNTSLDTALQFKLNTVQASYSNRTEVFEGDSTLVDMVQGSDVFASGLSHWANDSIMRYDTAHPFHYNTTYIQGTYKSGTAIGGSIHPDKNGEFTHSMTQGKYVKIIRDIKGSSADSAATDVMRVINGSDAYWVLKTVLEDTAGFIPTIFQMIAMDVNRDGIISSGDISQINLRTVGKYPEFRQKETHRNDGTSLGQLALDWVFIDSSRTKIDASYQLSSNYPDPDATGGCTKNQVPIPSIVIALPVIGSGSCPKVLPENYYGVLYGDVDGNWDADTAHMSAFKKASNALLFTLDSSNVSEGKAHCSFQIPVSIKSQEVITSVDFDIRSANPNMVIERIENHKNAISSLSNIKKERQALLTSYYSKPGGTKGFPKEETLFTVHLSGTGDLSPNDLIIKKAIFNGQAVQASILGIAECGIEAKDTASALEKPQVEELDVFPNPTDGLVYVNLPTDDNYSSVVCTVHDVSGRQLVQTQPRPTDTLIEMNLHHLAPGTYLVHLSTDQGTWYKKIMIQ